MILSFPGISIALTSFYNSKILQSKAHTNARMKDASRFQMPLLVKISVGLSLVFLLCQFVLLFFCSCKCSHTEGSDFIGSIPQSQPRVILTIDGYKQQIDKLNEKINELEKLVKKYQKLDQFVITEEFYQNKKSPHDLTFLKSYSPRNEHEMIPFSAFNSKHLFGDIGFLSKRPQAQPIGQQASELREALKYAMSDLNQDVEANNDRVTIDQFVEGITRNDFTRGTVYDLYFRSSRSNNVFKRVKLLRPYNALRRIGKPETIDTFNEIINIIVPLSGRIDKFKSFMDRLVDVAIRRDKRVFITVVHFGNEGRDEIKSYFLKMSAEEKFDDYKVIFTQDDFSRGKALQKGAKSWNKGNVLMFFCDIDIYFNEGFLERCRLHTSPGSKVYYPIVFSQYNPNIIYGGKDPPVLDEQMRILPESGFWRDFGFGMTCQYRDDFFNVGGFDLSIKGWGGEDIALYKQYLRQNLLTIVRAYDPGLFHIYHSKNCRKTLSDAQFISCLQSKAIAEGSHKQLGMLAFGSTLVNGKDPDWANRLRTSLNEIASEEKIDSGLKI